MQAEPSKLTGWRWPLVGGAVILLANLATLPVGLTEGDAGEWLVIARYGGIPHPSGYPLYALLCRLAATLAPPLPLVTAVALVSAIAAGVAAALTARALVHLRFSAPIAAAATVAVFLCGAVWRVTNMPEPFALNLLLAASILLLGARAVARGDAPAPRAEPVWLGLWFGLGLCNHHSLVWLVPVGLVVLAADQVRWWGRAARFAGGFALGLVPLNYFWFARLEDSPYEYYTVDSLAQLGALVLRTTYGTFSLAKRDTAANWDSVAHFAGNLPEWLSWFLVAAVLLGVLTWRRWQLGLGRPSRWFAWAWGASFFGAGLVFLRLFNVPVEGWIGSVVERFMALPTYLLVLPLAVGLERGSHLLRQRSPVLTVALLVAVVAGHGLTQLGGANRRAETFYEGHVHTLFEITRLGGDQLITASDAESYAALHGRYVLGLGADALRWLNATHWPSRRFRERTVRKFALPAESAELSRTAFVATMLRERGRVVVADLPRPPLPSLFAHSFVVGPTIILVRPEDPLPPPDEVWAINQALFTSAPLPRGAARDALSAWDRALFDKYLAGLDLLGASFEQQGRADLRAAAAALRAQLSE